MTLFMDQGNLFTLAPGAIAFVQFSYLDGLDHGPLVVSASIQAAENNVTATTIQTSVIVFYVQGVAYHTYTSLIRNDSISAFAMKVNIGNFK